MEFNSTSLVDSFSQFLSEITAEKKVKQGSLISYASEINFKFEDKLDSILKSSENSFYFSSPERNLSFVSLDQVYSIDENGPARFSSTEDRKSTRLNSSHVRISYAVFCLKKKR